MALDLHAFETWRAIAGNAELFAAAEGQAARAARQVVTACLKAKTTGLAQVVRMRAALGAQAFGLILDGMADAQIRTLVKRFDPHNGAAGKATPQGRRQHLLALAAGEIAAAARPPVRKKAATGRVRSRRAAAADDGFTSAGAVRKRTGPRKRT